MNQRTEESVAALLMRILSAIICVFILLFTVNAIAVRSTFFNSKFWIGIMTSDETVELAIDEMELSLGDLLSRENPGFELNSRDDKAMTEDFVRLLLNEYTELVIEGDRNMDDDSFHDFMDEYGDILLDAYPDDNMSRSELEDEFSDKLEDLMDEYLDEIGEDESLELLQSFGEINRNLGIFIIVCSSVMIILVVVTMILHKNKFRPIRAYGISLTVAQFLSCIGWLFMVIVLNELHKEYRAEGGIGEVLAQLFKERALSVALIMAGLLVLGIVMIIVGAVGAHKVDNSYSEDEV